MPDVMMQLQALCNISDNTHGDATIKHWTNDQITEYTLKEWVNILIACKDSCWDITPWDLTPVERDHASKRGRLSGKAYKRLAKTL